MQVRAQLDVLADLMHSRFVAQALGEVATGERLLGIESPVCWSLGRGPFYPNGCRLALWLVTKVLRVLLHVELFAGP